MPACVVYLLVSVCVAMLFDCGRSFCRRQADLIVAVLFIYSLSYRSRPQSHPRHRRAARCLLPNDAAYPWFQQINPDGDVFHSKASSSESGTERLSVVWFNFMACVRACVRVPCFQATLGGEGFCPD